MNLGQCFRVVLGTITMAMETFRPTTNGIDEVIHAFSERAARHKKVAAILTLPSGHAQNVWTVLNGDKTGTARQAIYDLEFTTIQEHPDALLDFRVVDLAEFPPEERPYVVPTGAVPLFVRDKNVLPQDIAGGNAV